jgi:hemerythrin-like metal-binding protein
MEVSHEPIVWSDALMTGVQEIDEQHQILVNMLNEANARLTEYSGHDVLQNIIRDLMSYALYHFDTEEELMVENQYNQVDRENHFREHRGFSDKVSKLQQDLRQGKLVSREELLSFLNGWLINHILKTDMQLGRFLKQSSP